MSLEFSKGIAIFYKPTNPLIIIFIPVCQNMFAININLYICVYFLIVLKVSFFVKILALIYFFCILFYLDTAFKLQRAGFERWMRVLSNINFTNHPYVTFLEYIDETDDRQQYIDETDDRQHNIFFHLDMHLIQ